MPVHRGLTFGKNQGKDYVAGAARDPNRNEQENGNKYRSAKQLGISRQNLQYKIRKFDL